MSWKLVNSRTLLLILHELVQTLAAIQPDDLIYRSIAVSETVTEEAEKKGIAYRVALNGDAKSLTVLDDFKTILAQADDLNFLVMGLRSMRHWAGGMSRREYFLMT